MSRILDFIDDTADYADDKLDKTARRLQSINDRHDVGRREVIEGALGVALAGGISYEATDEDMNNEYEFEIQDGETLYFQGQDWIQNNMAPHVGKVVDEEFEANIPLPKADYLEVKAEITEDDVNLDLTGYQVFRDGDSLSEAEDYSLNLHFNKGHGSTTIQQEEGLHLSGNGARPSSGTGDYKTSATAALEFDWETAGDE